MVSLVDGVFMLILKNGGAMTEIWLEEGIMRMCKKYGVDAERIMKDALMECLHAKAISHMPWKREDADLNTWRLTSCMESETEIINHLRW